METQILSQQFKGAVLTEVKSASAIKIKAFWDNLEYNRFGFIPVLIVIVACVGGIAGAFAIQHSPARLALVVLSTGITESFILGMLSMRVIVLTAMASLVISLLAILLWLSFDS